MSRISRCAVAILSGLLFAAAAPGAPRVATLTPRWTHAGFGAAAGMAGLQGIPGGAGDRVLVSGNRSPWTFWQVARADDPVLGFRTTFVAAQKHSFLRRLLLADVVGDGRPEIVAAQSDGTVDFFALDPVRRVGGFSVPWHVIDLVDLKVAEVDGAPPVEIVISRSNLLEVRWPDGTLRASTPLTGGGGIAIGEMDGDSAPEIATDDGKVLDARTFEVEWTLGSCCAPELAAADIDGDGLDELVRRHGPLRAYDVDQRALKWETGTSLDPVGRFGLTDLGGDGVVDLLYGRGGRVRRVRAADLALEWEALSQFGPAPASLQGVSLGVGESEVVFDGASSFGSGPDSVILLATDDGAEVARIPDEVGYAGPVSVGGRGAVGGVVAIAKRKSGTSLGQGVVVHLERDGGRGRSLTPLSAARHRQVVAVASADLDDDGAPELLVAGDDQYQSAVVAAYRQVADDFELLWESAVRPEFGRFEALLVDDLDGDGGPEVIAGGAVGFLAFDGADGSLRRSLPPSTIPKEMFLANADDDPERELIVIVDDGHISAVDLATGERTTLLDGTFSASAREGERLLLGDRDGWIWSASLGPAGLAASPWFRADDRKIEGMALRNDRVWTASYGVVRRFRDGRLEMESGFLGFGFGTQLLLDERPGLPQICGAGPIQFACFPLATDRRSGAERR